MGWLVQRYGYPTAFGAAACLAALALPYFLFIDSRTRKQGSHGEHGTHGKIL